MTEPSEFEQDLQMLEEQLRRLEVEYGMFFSGRLPRPPHEARSRVDRLIKQYDRAHLSRYADRFRFMSLQSRYVKLSDLWERALRAREEGRPGPFHAPQSAGDAQAHGAERKVLYTSQLSNPRRQTDRLRALYDSLARARRATGEPPIPYNKFAQLIAQQVKRLGGSSHSEVAFRVAVKDGKVSLTARPPKK